MPTSGSGDKQCLIGTLKRKRRKKNEQIGGLREFLEEERSIWFLESIDMKKELFDSVKY